VDVFNLLPPINLGGIGCLLFMLAIIGGGLVVAAVWKPDPPTPQPPVQPGVVVVQPAAFVPTWGVGGSVPLSPTEGMSPDWPDRPARTFTRAPGDQLNTERGDRAAEEPEQVDVRSTPGASEEAGDHREAWSPDLILNPPAPPRPAAPRPAHNRAVDDEKLVSAVKAGWSQRKLRKIFGVGGKRAARLVEEHGPAREENGKRASEVQGGDREADGTGAGDA